MSATRLSSEQWLKIREFLRDQTDLYIGKEAECRRFIDSVLWITRTGAQWRMLPAEYGRWNSVYKRFAPMVRARSLGANASAPVR